ncbi:MAG: hypothetical protein R3D59_06615 [Paracoccaceae bacterium]
MGSTVGGAFQLFEAWMAAGCRASVAVIAGCISPLGVDHRVTIPDFSTRLVEDDGEHVQGDEGQQRAALSTLVQIRGRPDIGEPR